MPVEFLASKWPATLEECGPTEDPTLLLIGAGEIGGSPVQLIALRVKPSERSSPDYRDDLADGSYRASALTAVLDATLDEMDFIASEFSEVLGDVSPCEVQLGGASYRIWLTSGPVSDADTGS